MIGGVVLGFAIIGGWQGWQGYQRNQGEADGWGQAKKLAASDAENGDRFGYSVAISGDTIIVGAYGEDGGGTDRGAAYIFERIDRQWIQDVKLTPAGGAPQDRSGEGAAHLFLLRPSGVYE